jgi:hypothetical protein
MKTAEACCGVLRGLGGSAVEGREAVVGIEVLGATELVVTELGVSVPEELG